MTDQPSGWSQGPTDSEARWRASDRELKLHSFKVALGIFGGLALLSVGLMATVHVVFIPFLTVIMGIRAAIIGWQVFGKEQATPTRHAAPPPTGWQQPAVPPPPPPLASQAPPAAGPAPSGAAVPPPPPPTWAPRQDLGDWSQSMPASPKPQGESAPPPPPPPPQQAASG
jgi:hypothetical protein